MTFEVHRQASWRSSNERWWPTAHTVCIVDDSAVMRRGIRSLVETDDQPEIVAEAGNGEQALAAVRRLRPDVVLLDVRMPTRDGISVVREISEVSHVLMLTYSDESEVVLAALDEGAIGYLVHGSFDADRLGAMVRAAAEGTGSLSGPPWRRCAADGPRWPAREDASASTCPSGRPR